MPFELKERFVIAAEQELGASLPDAYRRAMMMSNGGRVLAYDDVWDLYPILDRSDRKRLKRSCNDILHETEFMRDWPGWPENALAIASNGTADRLVLLKTNRWYEPTVHVWFCDTGELVTVADDVSDLAVGRRSDGPVMPKGYVLTHRRATRAAGYSHWRLQGEDLNKLEESVRYRRRRI